MIVTSASGDDKCKEYNIFYYTFLYNLSLVENDKILVFKIIHDFPLHLESIKWRNIRITVAIK